MSPSKSSFNILYAALCYWSDLAERRGRVSATCTLLSTLWEFARDSTPARLRSRYGDADYDWDHRVNTSSAGVGWQDRLLGMFHSPYQPTEPGLFREMLEALQQHANLNFADFTYLDFGSGKGRTLLMASDYPFRRIVGVELLPSLNQIAQENLGQYKNDSQRCFAIESICADASTFLLPDGPLVLYLFNPLPETALRLVVGNLEQRLRADLQSVYVLYHNPLLEHVLRESAMLRKIFGTHQYSIYAGGLASDASRGPEAKQII
jgi:SAM-dependent methyltransferase